MFLLDTNVLSDLRRRNKTNHGVAAWMDRAPSAELFISVVTIIEIETGALSIRRRDPAQGRVLKDWIDTHILPSFDGNILPVDTAVALKCAELHVPDPRPERDAMIAATAIVHGLTVVTRNLADFFPMGVKLLNPFID